MVHALLLNISIIQSLYLPYTSSLVDNPCKEKVIPSLIISLIGESVKRKPQLNSASTPLVPKKSPTNNQPSIFIIIFVGC